MIITTVVGVGNDANTFFLLLLCTSTTSTTTKVDSWQCMTQIPKNFPRDRSFVAVVSAALPPMLLPWPPTVTLLSLRRCSSHQSWPPPTPTWSVQWRYTHPYRVVVCMVVVVLFQVACNEEARINRPVLFFHLALARRLYSPEPSSPGSQPGWRLAASPAAATAAAAAGKAVKIMHEGLSSPCSHVFFFVIAVATRKVRRETGGGAARRLLLPLLRRLLLLKWTALSSKFDQRLLSVVVHIVVLLLLLPLCGVARFSGPHYYYYVLLLLSGERRQKKVFCQLDEASKWLLAGCNVVSLLPAISYWAFLVGGSTSLA